jgi:hypothetical protein
MIMNREDLFPSRYFKADDLPRAGLPVKIEGVTRERIGQEQKDKPVITFVNQTKSLVMNKTNYESIADILGNGDTDTWPGRIIVLFPDKTSYAGKPTPCVRVKKYMKPAAIAAKPQPTEIDPPPAESVPADHDQDEEEF